MSFERVRTTHVGSLPRPQDVVDQLFAQDRGEDFDPDEFGRVIAGAVRDVVRKQVEAGVDVVSDGEMSKIGYATYVRHRLSGFELGDVPRATPADLDAYPRFRDRLAAEGATAKYLRPICRWPIAYDNREPLERDLARFREARDVEGVVGADAAFMNAPSPGIIALFLPNEHYPSADEYLEAIAEAMKTEYEAIVESGILLQVDAPDLAMGRHIMYRDRSDEEFVASAGGHVDALNHALRDVPAERVRLHVCWGNYEGPHHLDVGVEKIVDLILRAKPSTILFEASNPRHAHEWTVWRDASIPDDKVLAPGVLDTTTNFIEHPELVAERIGRFADIVGPERVLAGIDCGFGTWAGFGPIDPDICWAKLRSLAEGAALASKRAVAGERGTGSRVTSRSAPDRSRARVMTLAEAVSAHVRDGDAIALEGFTHLIPFAAGHEVIRQGRTGLTLVRMTPDLIYDQMIGMGCAARLVFSYGGNPGVGSLHRFRDAVENGWPRPLEVEEHSHAGMANAYVAGASGLPFAVLRGYAGTDLATKNDSVAFVDCPFTGQRLTAVRALNPDVAVIHAQQADENGNVMIWGLSGVQKEAVLAARRSIVTVEELVSRLELRPRSVVLPSWAIDAIAVVPGGAWPSYAAGYSVRDNDFYAAWDAVSRDRDGFLEWMRANVVEAAPARSPASQATT